MLHWFRNLKVKAKMVVSFMVVIALMAGLSVFAFLELGNVTSSYQYAIDHPMSSEMDMSRFISAIRDMRRASATMGMFAPQNDPARIESYYQGGVAAYNEGMDCLDSILANVKSDIKATDEVVAGVTAVVGDLRDTFQRYMDTFCKPVYEAARVGDYEATLVYAANAAPLANELSEKADALITICIATAEEALAESADAVRYARILIVVVAIFSSIIAIIIALFVAGLLGKPLSMMARALDQLGTTGDLDFPPEVMQSAQECSSWQDEIGRCARAFGGTVQHIGNVAKELNIMANGDLNVAVEQLSAADVLGKSLNHMADNLNSIFGEINQSTAQVSSGSKQIADGAQSLAQGSTEQASSIERLSASVTEIAQKTKDNAEMAGKAAVLANTIKQNAEKGSRQMDEMTTAVKEINTASQNIKKVIKVIDDIAFQTNILALNAAVEAARAGQHGKGFAVVAEEVRNLASKSADAARETGEMIENSMEKAELGTRIADDTAASLAEIVSGINESSRIVTEIAQSSDEQSAGIAQINSGIDQVASVVQQNSATAEESAAASEEMSGQSAVLEELVAQFKLKDEGRSARAKRLPATSGRQIAMPERTPQNGGGDFGKY
ncbi:MAG: methyl-accepting chemotaxis protein [Oscillospiraceae bacterium]|nr:methyl-accepting chemotaxis protein [Oscillospiraceae bacterium]